MELTFAEVLKILIKRIKVIALVVILSVVIAVGYNLLFVKPVYSANATVLIASGALFKEEGTQTNSEYITTGELSTSFALMKSFSGILTESVEYYDKALAIAKDEGLNNDYTVKSLASATKIKYDEDSIILDITVNTNDAQDAEVLIAALAECAPGIITSKLGRTSAVVLNVDAYAGKVSMGTVTCALIAFACGLAIAIILALAIEKLDKTVKGEDDFLKAHNVPLLGSVPDFESKNKRRIVD